jgi:hypothetical protein
MISRKDHKFPLPIISDLHATLILTIYLKIIAAPLQSPRDWTNPRGSSGSSSTRESMTNRRSPFRITPVESEREEAEEEDAGGQAAHILSFSASNLVASLSLSLSLSLDWHAANRLSPPRRAAATRSFVCRGSLRFVLTTAGSARALTANRIDADGVTPLRALSLSLSLSLFLSRARHYRSNERRGSIYDTASVSRVGYAVISTNGAPVSRLH